MSHVVETVLIIAIAAAALAQEAAGQRDEFPGKGLLKPMKLPGSTYEVRAGKLEVWENHRTKTGRKIALNVIVIPAKARDPIKAPLFLLSGGPGVAATKSAAGWLTDFDLPYCMYADRDVVLVDQRGTGESNPLIIPAAMTSDVPLQAILTPADQPAEYVKAFRNDLEKHADLKQYGTARFVEDLEEVRKQLGYDKIDLWGMSYGTRPAQEYIRRYPDRVRSVVFLGSFPNGTKYLAERSLYAQRAIERLIEDCSKNEACRRAFPEIKQEFDELLARLAKEPARAKLKHPRRDAAEELQITRETFTEKLRVLQSSHQSMPMLPYVIHQAHRGNYDPFLKLAIPPKLDGVDASWGLYLCVVFTDDIPFINYAQWDRVSQQTYMGNNLVKLARQFQGIWPTGDAPSDFHDPVSSDIPALLITGHFDTLTPFEGGEELARRFRNSKHVIVPEMSHMPFGLPNEQDDFLSVLDDFFDRGSVDGLDTSRLNGLKAPPYLTSDIEFRLKMLLWWR